MRSRDPEVLSNCDVVIDVGGVYEPDNNRYDHHQRGFTEVFGHGFNTKLSSAGGGVVVWCGCSCVLPLMCGVCMLAPACWHSPGAQGGVPSQSTCVSMCLAYLNPYFPRF